MERSERRWAGRRAEVVRRLRERRVIRGEIAAVGERTWAETST
jgi:hypothetical protein